MITFLCTCTARYQNFGASAPFSYKFEEDDDDFVTVDKRTVTRSQHPFIMLYIQSPHTVPPSILPHPIAPSSHPNCCHSFLRHPIAPPIHCLSSRLSCTPITHYLSYAIPLYFDLTKIPPTPQVHTQLAKRRSFWSARRAKGPRATAICTSKYVCTCYITSFLLYSFFYYFYF